MGSSTTHSGKLITKTSKYAISSKKTLQWFRNGAQKNFGQDGDLVVHGGGTKIFLDGGGQVLMGGDSPFMGYGPPPHPPHVRHPWSVLY